MYLTETGYWVPDKNEVIILNEIPHVVQMCSYPTQENKISTRTWIPKNPQYEFNFHEGMEILVKNVTMHQDIHYEWLSIESIDNEFCKSNNVAYIEIPLRYCVKHPTIKYKNTYKK